MHYDPCIQICNKTALDVNTEWSEQIQLSRRDTHTEDNYSLIHEKDYNDNNVIEHKFGTKIKKPIV